MVASNGAKKKLIKTDWDVLAICGAPLFAKTSKDIKPSSSLLKKQLSLAAKELQTSQTLFNNSRKLDAFIALLLAIKVHFPTFFNKNLLKLSKSYLTYLDHPTGRIIKLKRQAVSIVCTYL